MTNQIKAIEHCKVAQTSDSVLVKSKSAVIQLKAIEQYFPAVLNKVILTFASVDEILNQAVIIQMKAIKQYFLSCRTLFIIL